MKIITPNRAFSALFFILINFTSGIAQVGIGTYSPDASSILDIKSKNAGLLIPRLELKGINYSTPVSKPANGLLVYNINTQNDVTPGFYFWANDKWNRISETVNAWNTSGNKNTTDDNFLGTTDSRPLNFRVADNKIASFGTSNNISFGLNATAANRNAIAIGDQANAATSNSIAFGYVSNSTGDNAVSIGWDAIASGKDAYAIGRSSRSENSNTVAIGRDANANGANGISLGVGAKSSGSNATAIGYQANATQDNSIILGNSSSSSNRVGVGTNTPNQTSILDVNSTSKGALIPRMTAAQRTAITNPATGLLVYDTTRKCLSQQVGTPSSPDWVCISGNVVRFFYLPSLNIDTSTKGTGRTVNLYQSYKDQFSSPVVSSPGASGIPYFKSASDLEYYVTAYDTSVLSNLSINSNGVLTYDVIGSATPCSFINVVLVVK